MRGISWLAIVLVFQDRIYSMEIVPNTIRAFRRNHVLSKRPYTDSPLKQLHIPEEANPHHYSVFALLHWLQTASKSPYFACYFMNHVSILQSSELKVKILHSYHLRRHEFWTAWTRPPSTLPPHKQNRTMSLPGMQTPFAANDDSSLVVCDVLRDGRARDCIWQIGTSLTDNTIVKCKHMRQTNLSIDTFPTYTLNCCLICCICYKQWPGLEIENGNTQGIIYGALGCIILMHKNVPSICPPLSGFPTPHKPCLSGSLWYRFCHLNTVQCILLGSLLSSAYTTLNQLHTLYLQWKTSYFQFIMHYPISKSWRGMRGGLRVKK